MAFTRTRALRSLQTSLRHSGARASPRVAAPARTHLAVTRRYASGGAHGHGEPSSDIPWLIGGIVVTVPSCWYLWPEKHAEHHHDDHHDEAEGHEETAAEEKEEEKEEEAPKEEEPKEEESKSEEKEDKEESKDEEKSEEKSDDKEESKDEEKSDDKEKTKDKKRTTGKDQKDNIDSNSGAKHSTSPGEDKKSTRADGSVDTAKHHGTVDASKPTK